MSGLLVLQKITSNPSLQQLVEWFIHGQSKGTFLKTIYVEQIPVWLEEWDNIISEKGGLEEMNKSDWKSLVDEDHALIEHAPFILPLAHSLHHGVCRKVRKRAIRIFGIKIPNFPTLEENQQHLKEMIFEETEGDIDDHQFVELLRTKRIYIGKPIMKDFKVSTKKITLTGFQRSIRRVVIMLLETYAKSGYLILEKQENTIYLFDWLDAAPVFGKEIFVWQIGILFDKATFSEKMPQRKKNKSAPWVIGWFPETIEVVSHFRALEGKEFEELKNYPIRFVLSGVEYIFCVVPAVGRGDHSASRKAHGNKSGGTYRCGQCSASFSPRDIPLLFRFHHTSKLFRKTLKNAQVLFSSVEGRKYAQSIGWKEIPPILNSETSRSLESLNLDRFEIGPDNLHNGKGIIKTILQWEKNEKSWNESEFLLQLHKCMNKTGNSLVGFKVGTGMMDGADWRFLLVLFPDIILPAINNQTRKEQVAELFLILCEIQFLAYSGSSAQESHPICLRMHVLCFLAGTWIEVLYPFQGKCTEGYLYIHTVLTHYPQWFEKQTIDSASTEQGESFFAKVKRILLHYTNRHDRDALKEVFVRIFFEDTASTDIDQKVTEGKVVAFHP